MVSSTKLSSPTPTPPGEKRHKAIEKSSSAKEPTITESTHNDIPPSTTYQPHNYDKNTDNMEKLEKMGSNWLDEDNSNEHDWFDKMASLKTDKLTKSDIKRIKRKGFNMLKKSFTSSIELEYHLEQVALAMFEEID
ncbi:hypothetical protein Tco_0923472 [Tanacetum coccineum]|uniref:Uncharacterized protein n=1 Tax=Tanacetum coccineum TaxID=301880 RepID=A0ABQ5D252_9ASTR